MFKITKLEVEARREANASQERIATMFAAILAKNVPPTQNIFKRINVFNKKNIACIVFKGA